MKIMLYWLPLFLLFFFPHKVDDVYPVLTACVITAYTFTVLMRRQMFKGAYGTWLLQNNWQSGQKLIRGSLLFQLIDLLVLAPYLVTGAILYGSITLIPVMCFMVIVNALCLYFYYLQRKYMYIYLTLLLLSGLWLLPVAYFEIVAIGVYVANLILMRSVIRDWHARSLLGTVADASSPALLAKEQLPWPVSALPDAQEKRLCKLVFALASVASVHLLAMALAEVVSPTGYGVFTLFVAAFVVIEVCYVFKQVMQYRPTLSLSERLRTHRYILPYDRIFVRVLLGALLLVLVSTQFGEQLWVPWVAIIIPLLLAAIYAWAGPKRDEWILVHARHVFVLPDAERQKDAPKTLGDYYRKYFQQLDR